MSEFMTTLRQRKVYVLLINPQNPRRPRTQADVAHLLELPAERVSEACKALEKKGFVRRLHDGRRDLLYRRGPNCQIIESQIRASYLEDGMWFDTYGRALRPEQLAGPTGHEPHTSIWRTHLNGGWIQFTVLQEGELHHVDWHDGKRELRQELFPKEASRDLKGQLNWYTSLVHEKALVQLRYQKTPRVRHLYIIPGDVHQVAEDLNDDDLTPFMRYCFPILAWLEKWGGWRFAKKDGSNEYEYKANVKKEFGADEFTSQIIGENLGHDYGIVGQSPFWMDKSVPGGEAETSRAEYASYLSNLPGHFKQLQGQITELTRAYYQTLLEISQRQMAILQALERQVSITELQSCVNVSLTTADEQPEGYR